MDTNRKTAILVGVLFIIGTVAGILGAIFTYSIFNVSDYLTQISTHQNDLMAGALMVLTMGLALALVPVVMFPLFKKQNEVLALGYVVFRGALETFTYMAIVTIWIFLLVLSKEYATTDAADATYFQTMGASLLAATDWMAELTSIVFSSGALMYYYLFYQTRLIPRWLSGWGFIGAILYLASGVLAMVAIIEPLSTTENILRVPLGLQEMVMAVWLIVKGFESSAVAAKYKYTELT